MGHVAGMGVFFGLAIRWYHGLIVGTGLLAVKWVGNKYKVIHRSTACVGLDEAKTSRQIHRGVVDFHWLRLRMCMTEFIDLRP